MYGYKEKSFLYGRRTQYISYPTYNIINVNIFANGHGSGSI